MLDLFLTFAKVGLFTFGGGYAMISLIENSCVEKKGWITHDEMMNVTVIAESTPGPIAINCATFVGYKQKGMIGAIAATIGMVLPSFCIIFLISMFLDNFLEIAWIAHAFMGIKIAVGILILDAAIKMIRKMQKKPIPLTIMACAFLAMLLIDIFALHVSSITLMLIAAVISLAIFLTRRNTVKAGQPHHIPDKKEYRKGGCGKVIYFDLLIGFLKVGLFAFGGAYGAIPLIRDVVLSYGWIEDEMLTYMIAVSESTPGPIMVNLATYVGSSQAGFWGSLIATTAVVLPSFIIILLIMVLLKKMLKDPYVQAILRGLKPCIIGIILATGVFMILQHCFGSIRELTVNITAILMTAVLAVIYFGSRKVLKKGISPIGLIGISAVAGIIVYGFV